MEKTACVTPNDAGDMDVGANNLQNFPTISSALLKRRGRVRVTGQLNSTPNTQFTIEVFASPSVDPSGHGEGNTFLGTIDVTTDSLGNADFKARFRAKRAVNHFITATATDPNSNTSEFSAGVPIVSRGGARQIVRGLREK